MLVPKTLKTIQSSNHLPPIKLETFEDIELCVVVPLRRYIKMIAPFRNIGTKRLFLSFVQLLKPIPKITLSR